MTVWRLWPSTSGDAVAADTGTFSLGVEFHVTASGCLLNGYWWWCATGADTAAKSFRLYTVTTSTTGSLIANTSVTSGTLTAGAWNYVALSPSPVALTSGTHYRVSVYGNPGVNWYSTHRDVLDVGRGQRRDHRRAAARRVVGGGDGGASSGPTMRAAPRFTRT